MARRPWGGWQLSPAEERAAAVARGLPAAPQWRQQLEDLSFEHSTDTDILKVGNNLYTTCFNNIWQSRSSKGSPKKQKMALRKQASLPNLKHGGKQATSVPTVKLTELVKQQSSWELEILAGKLLYTPVQESHLKKWQLDASTRTPAASRIGFSYGVHPFAKTWPSVAANPKWEHHENHDGPAKELLQPNHIEGANIRKSPKTRHRAVKSLEHRMTIESNHEAVPGIVNGEAVKVVMTTNQSRLGSKDVCRKSSKERSISKGSSIASSKTRGSKDILRDTLHYIEDTDIDEMKEHAHKSPKHSSRIAHVPGDILKQAFDYFKSYAKYPTDAGHQDITEKGRLSSNRFIEVLREITGCARVNEIPKDVLDEALEHVGTGNLDDDDEGIGFEEFVVWFASHAFSEGLVLTPEQRHMREVARKYDMLYVDVEDYKRKFDLFDVDGSGVIEFEEFEALMGKMLKLPAGQEIAKHRLKGFWREADIDASGAIDFEEFLVFYRRYFGPDSMGGDHLGDIYHLPRPGGV